MVHNVTIYFICIKISYECRYDGFMLLGKTYVTECKPYIKVVRVFLGFDGWDFYLRYSYNNVAANVFNSMCIWGKKNYIIR